MGWGWEGEKQNMLCLPTARGRGRGRSMAARLWVARDLADEIVREVGRVAVQKPNPPQALQSLEGTKEVGQAAAVGLSPIGPKLVGVLKIGREGRDWCPNNRGDMAFMYKREASGQGGEGWEKSGEWLGKLRL
jgi:hypothetical protein